jgi:hypothetical protein
MRADGRCQSIEEKPIHSIASKSDSISRFAASRSSLDEVLPPEILTRALPQFAICREISAKAGRMGSLAPLKSFAVQDVGLPAPCAKEQGQTPVGHSKKQRQHCTSAGLDRICGFTVRHCLTLLFSDRALDNLD